MDGIYVSILGNNIIIEIHDLTDELKKKIKDELVEICQGEYALTSISSHCSFPKTIEELVDHRLPKDKNKKKDKNIYGLSTFSFYYCIFFISKSFYNKY